MKPQTLPHTATAPTTLTFIFDSAAALEAANRLQQKTSTGIRFCCEHRQQLSLAEAQRRDATEAMRRARLGEHADSDDETEDETELA